MAKKHLKKELLEKLSEVPNISLACKAVGLSRNTVYRWAQEDESFKKRFEDALKMGVDSINDLAESGLISAIREKLPWAIKYWLSNHKTEYITPREKVLTHHYRTKDINGGMFNIRVIDGSKNFNKGNSDDIIVPHIVFKDFGEEENLVGS